MCLCGLADGLGGQVAVAAALVYLYPDPVGIGGAGNEGHLGTGQQGVGNGAGGVGGRVQHDAIAGLVGFARVEGAAGIAVNGGGAAPIEVVAGAAVVLILVAYAAVGIAAVFGAYHHAALVAVVAVDGLGGLNGSGGHVGLVAVAYDAAGGAYLVPVAGLAQICNPVALVQLVNYFVAGAGALAHVKAGGGIVVAAGLGGFFLFGLFGSGCLIQLKVAGAGVGHGAVGGQQLIPVAGLADAGDLLILGKGANYCILGAGAGANVQVGGGVVDIAAVRADLELCAAGGASLGRAAAVAAGEVGGGYVAQLVLAELYLGPVAYNGAGGGNGIALFKVAKDGVVGAGAGAYVDLGLGVLHGGRPCHSHEAEGSGKDQYQSYGLGEFPFHDITSRWFSQRWGFPPALSLL